MWNCLPRSGVEASSLETIHTALNRAWMIDCRRDMTRL